MFSKLMVFFTIIIVLITINSNYHFHVDDHHDHYHVEVDTHEITAEQLSFHYSEHTEYQENTGLMGSILLLIILFTSTTFFFFLSLKNQIIQLVPISTFFRHIFIDPLPILTRYILFHAPPTHHS